MHLNDRKSDRNHLKPFSYSKFDADSEFEIRFFFKSKKPKTRFLFRVFRPEFCSKSN